MPQSYLDASVLHSKTTNLYQRMSMMQKGTLDAGVMKMRPVVYFVLIAGIMAMVHPIKGARTSSANL